MNEINYYEEFNEENVGCIKSFSIIREERMLERKSQADYILDLGTKSFEDVVGEIVDVITSTRVDQELDYINIWVDSLDIELAFKKSDKDKEYTQYDVFKVAYAMAVVYVLHFKAAEAYKIELTKWLIKFNYKGLPFDQTMFQSLSELKEGGDLE